MACLALLPHPVSYLSQKVSGSYQRRHLHRSTEFRVDWVSGYKIWQEEAQNLSLFLTKSQPTFLFSSLPTSLSCFMSLQMLSEINQFTYSCSSSPRPHASCKSRSPTVCSPLVRCHASIPSTSLKLSRYCSFHRGDMTMKTKA